MRGGYMFLMKVKIFDSKDVLCKIITGCYLKYLQCTDIKTNSKEDSWNFNDEDTFSEYEY